MVSPKRSLPPSDSDQPEPKRARLDPCQRDPGDYSERSSVPQEKDDDVADVEEEEEMPSVSYAPTPHHQARLGIQRSIAMVLQHDGFDTATPEALEEFTQMVETYVDSMIDETKWLAASARRECPAPVDFGKMLKRHNVPVSSLKPHLNPPIPKEKAVPVYAESITLDEGDFTTLPILSIELSGQPDKDTMPHIPKAFPDFPSRHTYNFTPQEDVIIRDPKKTREQAAKTAQEGEEALRGLVRASKMRKQKEVKALVERDPEGKERYRLWEATMKKFMGMAGRGEHSDQVEIADHSMLVNSDATFGRKEVSRLGKRTGTMANGNLA